MTDKDALDYLAGGSPTATFPEIGTTYEGRIRELTKSQQRDFQSGALKFFDNGDPMVQLVFTIETGLRDGDEDDGVRRVFAKGQMLDEIRRAIRESGHARGADVVGGILKVGYVSDGEPASRGISPPKVYRAKFTPPAVDPLGDDGLGQEPF
jgi:hypothetical protein